MAIYTVTVAGSERHDGEKPYTYVIEDEDVVPVSVLSGEPSPNCGYSWNELRLS